MERWRRFFTWLRGLANLEIGAYLRPTPGKVAAAGSVLAVLSLVYVLGAAVMYFRLPSSVFLTKAFMGAEDWSMHRDDSSETTGSPVTATPKLKQDIKGVACDGYTLCMTDQGPRATLIDMRGRIVYQWKMNSRMAWPRAPHVQDPLPDEPVHWDNCHVYPDGALLALCSRGGDRYGYGLMKLDKNSKLLWAYSGNVHHDFTVADDGRIYALAYRVDSRPPPGLPGAPKTFLAEDLLVLSPDGKPLATIPLYEAFRHSNFAMLFDAQLRRSGIHTLKAAPLDPTGNPLAADAESVGDYLHGNSVKVLPQALAARFPQFKPGWAMLSFRTSSIIALIDPEKRHVVWAAIGPWQRQHDAQFLANGHLLLFDNAGAGNGPRILEYDPVSRGIAWAYTPEDFDRLMKAPFGGACQRLPNGNTLICDWHRSVFEVTMNKQTVWESHVPGHVRALRYFPEELPFLPAGTTPR
jgi:hypothetical protein